jgi:hypothetical protein
MTLLDPALPANEPRLAQALRHVRNSEPSSRFNCHCGQCPFNEDTYDIDRAIDACLMDALNLVDTLTDSQLAREPGDRLALHSLHGLLTHGRLMCCVQRYAARSEGPHEA